MSSSFGGGSGGSGSAGTVRYAIVIDDSQVNSKLANFQSQLGQLNATTSTAGSGLTTINTGLQTMDTNLQQTSTDLDAINNNFRNMDSSIQSTSQEMGALNNNFQEASGGLTKFNTLQGTVGDGTQTMGQKLQSVGGFLKNNALAVTAVSSSVIGLVSNYTSLQKAQLGAERATLISERAQQKVVKIQEKLNKMQIEGKEGTKEYAITLKDFEIAQDAAGIATERAALATQTANQQMASFIPETASQLVLLGSGAASMFSAFADSGLKMSKLKGGFEALSHSLGGLRGALALVAIPLAAFFAAVAIGEFALNKAKSELDEYVKHFGDSVLKITGFEEALLNIKALMGDPVAKETLDLLNKQKKIIQDLHDGLVTIDEAKTKFKELGGSATGTERSFDNLLDILTDVKDDTLNTAEATEELGTSSENAKTSVSALTTSGLKPLEAGVKTSTLILETMTGTVDAVAESHVKMGLEVEDVYDQITGSLDKSLPVWEKQIEAAKTSTQIMGEIGSVLGGLPAKEDSWTKSIEDADKKLDDHNKTIQESQEKFMKLVETWNKFKDSSRIDIADKLGLKGVDEKVDKLVDKIVDDLPKKIDGVKIKTNIKMEIDKESIGRAAGQIIGGLNDEISGSDEVADAVAKSIKQNLPNTDAGDAMKKFLEAAIEESNTAQILKDNLIQLEDGSFVLTIPTTAEITSVDLSDTVFQDNNVGEDVMSKLDTRGARFKGKGKGLKIPVDSAELVPKTYTVALGGPNGDLQGTDIVGPSGIDRNNPGGGSRFNGGMGTDFLQVPISGAELQPKEVVFGPIATDAIGNFQIIAKTWDQVVVAKIADGASALASHWSTQMNSFMKNASVAGNGIYKNLNSSYEKVTDKSDDLASHWSSVMNSFINNAEAAADGVNKALGKIKDVNVTIRVGLSGAGSPFIEQLV